MQSLEKLIAEVTAQLQMLCALKTQRAVCEDGVNHSTDGHTNQTKTAADYHGNNQEQLNGNPS